MVVDNLEILPWQSFLHQHQAVQLSKHHQELDILVGVKVTFPYMSAMNKMDFTTDAMSLVPGAKLTIGRRHVFATSSITAGYFAEVNIPIVHLLIN